MQIPAILTTRQWMRAAKAWRCHLELPNDKVLAAQLTAYIESKLVVTIAGEPEGSRQIEINPAFVVDVALKGKRFFLVVETVYEGQACIGPYLTALVGEKVVVTLEPLAGEAPKQTQERGDIAPAILTSLHTKWFKNEAFWRFLTARTHINIDGEATCKAVFKHYLKVESCANLSQEAFDAMLADFNGFMRLK